MAIMTSETTSTERVEKISVIQQLAICSPILLLLFVHLLELAKDSENFLGLTFFSFVSLGLATCVLLFSKMEDATRIVRYILYAITVILLITVVVVANSLVIVPRGGLRHSYSILPDDFEGTMEWSDGYYSKSFEQTLLEVDYPVGEVYTDWDMDEIHLMFSRSMESLSGRFWLSLEFHPNHDKIRLWTNVVRNFTLSGTSTGIDLWSLSFNWGSFNPEDRIRLDKGYTIVLWVDILLWASEDYGNFSVHIPLSYVQRSYSSTPSHVDIRDVQVTTQLQDGTAVLLCGVFFGINAQMVAKPAVSFLKKRVFKRVQTGEA